MNDSGSGSEKPLSSAEMIRKAREDLSRPTSPPDPGIRDREAIGEAVEAEMPPMKIQPGPRRPMRQVRPRRAESGTPTGFGQPSPRRSGNALILAVSVALVILGIAVLLAVAGTATP